MRVFGCEPLLAVVGYILKQCKSKIKYRTGIYEHHKKIAKNLSFTANEKCLNMSHEMQAFFTKKNCFFSHAKIRNLLVKLFKEQIYNLAKNFLSKSSNRKFLCEGNTVLKVCYEIFSCV